jgi:hypothetical protein
MEAGEVLAAQVDETAVGGSGMNVWARHHVGAPVPGRLAADVGCSEDGAGLIANTRNALGTTDPTPPVYLPCHWSDCRVGAYTVDYPDTMTFPFFEVPATPVNSKDGFLSCLSSIALVRLTMLNPDLNPAGRFPGLAPARPG